MPSRNFGTKKNTGQGRPGPALGQGVAREDIRQVITSQREGRCCSESPPRQSRELFPDSDDVHEGVHQQAAQVQRTIEAHLSCRSVIQTQNEVEQGAGVVAKWSVKGKEGVTVAKSPVGLPGSVKRAIHPPKLA